MAKYVAWIPTWGSVKYVLETDEELSGDELRDRFEAEAEAQGGLCHQCSDGNEIGDDPVWEEWDGTIAEGDCHG